MEAGNHGVLRMRACRLGSPSLGQTHELTAPAMRSLPPCLTVPYRLKGSTGSATGGSVTAALMAMLKAKAVNRSIALEAISTFEAELKLSSPFH